jgi:type I restriction enzyme, S subunit
MEVKPGYKQTEVGVIPDDWQTCTIQELIDRGAIVGHLDGNHGELYPRSNEFQGAGVPYITANDLTGHTVSFDSCKYLSEERACRFRKGVAKDGDVLFAHNATVGPTALLTTELDFVILSTTATYFRCNPEKLSNSFLLYMLQADCFVHQYRAVMTQSTRNQVPITTQRKLSVILPSTKEEQETIARTLSDADTLIESLKQLIAKKRQIKQGAMQELLTGKKRLQGFKGVSLVQTELGFFPGDWELTRLGDIVDPSRDIRYGIVQPGKYDSKGRYMIRGQDYSKGWASPSEVFKVSDLVEEKYKNARVMTGDLIITIVGTCGVVETIPAWLDGANLTQTTARVAILSSKADSYFCKYMLQTEVGARQVASFMKGGVQPGLNCGDVEKFMLPLPKDLTEQVAIATILSDMDSDIATQEEKLAKARMIKQGMMQELLTGRIRLI